MLDVCQSILHSKKFNLDYLKFACLFFDKMPDSIHE